MGDSGDFIFRRTEGGDLTYRGDFEGLYRAITDPWGQSGEHPRMKAYYEFSRRRLLNTLKGTLNEFPWTRLLEVGCGKGQVVDLIHHSIEPRRVVHGCDVSKTAIARAWSMFPDGFFFHLDITQPDALDRQRWSELHYDVVVLSQILWYVLERLPTVFDNCSSMLVPHGHLIIQTAFLDQQGYGRGIVDGWHGLIRWVLESTEGWQIVGASYDASDRHAPYHDGVLVLRRGA
jgi:SAM-dependent methyltransferase